MISKAKSHTEVVRFRSGNAPGPFCVDGYKRQRLLLSEKRSLSLLKQEHMFAIISLQTEAQRFR